MSSARGWIALAVVAIAIAGAAYLLQPRQPDSPEHSTNSDAGNGASAALLFAQSMGHPVDQLGGGYSLPDPSSSAMFVFSPTSQFSPAEADRTRAWVSSGGTLIYASEQGDPELDRAFNVRRFSSPHYSPVYYGVPVMAGIDTVATAQSVTPLDPSLDQVSFLRTGAGYSVGFFQHIGRGTAYVLADPLVLCNGYLGNAGNGRLLANLLPSDPAARVVFDEYHHGITVADFAPQTWLLTPWGFGLLWLLVGVFFAFFLRGRRFGPLVPRPAEIARSEAEWSVAIGELLRRSRARSVALGLLATATERAVAARTGLPLQPRERFWNALWVRAPQVATDLAEVENSLQALNNAAVSEREVLNVARRLHRIAHPTPGAR
jgi:hypothetical protein